MTALLEGLNALSTTPLGTVVHINPPDDEALVLYSRFGAKRVVIVHTDPDTLASLRRCARDFPAIEVVEAAVASSAAEVQWLRYNVPEVSGTLRAASSLHAVYPRLRLLDSLSAVTVTLQGLLKQLALDPPEVDRHNLLVLEVQGLEGPVLEGLDPQTLGHFDLVLMRGAEAGVLEGAGDFERARQWLHDRHYRPMGQVESADPLWPVSLMRFEQAVADQASHARQVAELNAQAEKRSREHADAIALLERERIEQVGLIRERDKQIQSLTTDKRQLEEIAQERLVQLDALTKSRDEQVGLVCERDKQIQSLMAGKAQAEKIAQDRLAEIAALTAARDGQIGLVCERDKQVQSLIAGKAQTEKVAQDRLVQIDTLTKARDEQARLAAERLKRVSQLEAEMADLAARHGVLREELIKAEAHVEMISDLVLREALR